MTAATETLAQAFHREGAAALQRGNLVGGLDLLRRAVAEAPGDAAMWCDLGTAEQMAGRLDAAQTAFTRALELDPTLATAQYNLGNLYRLAGHMAEAEAAYRAGLALRGDHAPSLHNLAATLLDLGRPQEAVAVAEAACAAAPTLAAAHFARGNAYRACGRLEDAVAALRQACGLRDHYAEALTNLANVLSDQGRAEEALPVFQAAAAARPDDPRLSSNLLCALHYVPGITPEALREAHHAWAETHAAPEVPASPMRLLRPRTGPLAVGVVSADFGAHPVGWFTLALVEGAKALPPGALRLFLYSDRTAEDAVTARLEAAAHAFRRVRGLNDDQVAARIATDGVEVLIDASGHTAGNRLAGLFAHRAAPVQVTWAAYVGTTGLPAMDGLIADPWQVPDGEEENYHERILRLPMGYAPWVPPEDAHDPGPPPCLSADAVTFGSLNNPAKLSSATVTLWAALLTVLPQARLLLKYRGLDDPGTADRLRARFAAQDVAPDRLILEGGGTRAEMLAAYRRIDVALDPLPYSGGLTTLEALWMGVPVITLPGRTFASRHALSHLSNAGLGHLAAPDVAGYISRAVDLVSSPAALTTLRATLRQRLRDGAPCDGAGFARALRALLLPLARP